MPGAHIRDLMKAFGSDLEARAAGDDRLRPYVDHLSAAMADMPAEPSLRAAPADAPTALRHLGPALEAAQGAGPVLACLSEAAQALTWYQVFQGDGMAPDLSQGLLAAQIVGPAGCVQSADVRCGMFLLAPGVHYPNHTHAAAEIYYGLSGQLQLTYGLDHGAFTLHPGALSVTEPDRLHSLTTGDAPVLLMYLWTGAVDDPNWVWDRDPAGRWRRAKWRRRPDGAWMRATTEPVPDTLLQQALRH